MEQYLPLLKNKKVGVVCNHTSLIENTHLVDTLLQLRINVIKIFAPEHGFRGQADAGAPVVHEKDLKTQLPILSLYGKNKKPTPEMLRDVQIMLFDMQDVGCRFYTYLSTLHYVMEACAEHHIPLILLDRPNPNGFYVDGPVLEPAYKSFIGLHPIPVVHGMTLGELALMINGEKWLTKENTCSLHVVPCQGYSHAARYHLPVPPSPNLRNMNAIYLYPSLCLFEGTTISIGRGTDTPFEIIGHPLLSQWPDTFTPQPRPGAQSPPLLHQLCHGKKIQFHDTIPYFSLHWLLQAYQDFPNKNKFFNSYFDYLAGNSSLRKMIMENKSESYIRQTWQPALVQFKSIRKKYLLYPDTLP